MDRDLDEEVEEAVDVEASAALTRPRACAAPCPSACPTASVQERGSSRSWPATGTRSQSVTFACSLHCWYIYICTYKLTEFLMTLLAHYAEHIVRRVLWVFEGGSWLVATPPAELRKDFACKKYTKYSEFRVQRSSNTVNFKFSKFRIKVVEIFLFGT